MLIRRGPRSTAIAMTLTMLLSTIAIGASPADVVAGVGGVILTKTVMVDPTPEDETDGTCAATSSLELAQGTVVDYCFRIENASGVTLDTHTLVDAELGAILTNFPYVLVDGATAFITQQAVVNQSATRSATWTATDGVVTHADDASASVTVNAPALTLTMGVMVDASPADDGNDVCSPTSAIQLPATSAGTEVDYCFSIRNNTNQTFDRHDLVASGFGTVLDDFPYSLADGASAFITQSANVTYLADQRSGTWTARNVAESYTAIDAASVTVLLPFTDVASSKFLGSIVWLNEQAITAGCDDAPPRYCPNGLVTRGQMATFLSRALDLPSTAVDFFTDDETNKHEGNINRVAAAGITVGCSATRFCPDGLVTRGQMATFLSRAYGLPAAGTDFFSDDEANKHEANINRIAAAAITTGCTPTTYCPNGLVTRGQMAAFINRAEN